MTNTTPSDDLGICAMEAGLKQTGPIEVWLTQANLTVTCTIVYNDESTSSLDVDSLSMRGAQREITGWFIQAGYKPDGRWTIEARDDREDVNLQTWRRFRPTLPGLTDAK